MNIVFLAALILVIGGGLKGYKRGLIEEINTMTAMILAVLAAVMFLVAVKGYMSQETLKAILGIVCLTISVIVYKIVDFILSTLKIISAIPLIRSLNRLAGMAAGVLEALLIIWIICIVIVMFDLGSISSYLLGNIKENEILTYLFQNNPLTGLLAEVLPVLKAVTEIGSGALSKH